MGACLAGSTFSDQGIEVGIDVAWCALVVIIFDIGGIIDFGDGLRNFLE